MNNECSKLRLCERIAKLAWTIPSVSNLERSSMFNAQCSMLNVQCTTVIGEAIRFVEEGVKVALPVDGNSMLPFIIGGKESVVLQKPGELKVGDVVLAWTDDTRGRCRR